MKIKNHGLLLLAAALIMSLMSGCGQEDDRTYLSGDSGAGEAASAGTGSASSPEAGSEALDESLSLLTDIATTQYFTDEAVDSGDIETILSAGINAPSAMNGQNWHLSAISDRELLTQIAGDMSSGASDGTGASDNSAPAKAGIADAPWRLSSRAVTEASLMPAWHARPCRPQPSCWDTVQRLCHPRRLCSTSLSTGSCWVSRKTTLPQLCSW